MADAATNLSFLGIAKETVKGTAVTPSFYIPVTKLEPEDKVAYLEDKGYRGAMAELYGEILGVKYSEYSVGGDVYADAIGWAIAGVLGDVATTGAGAPFSHVCSLKNDADGQPVSHTLSDYAGLTGTFTKQYAGCQWSELSLKGNADGMLTWDAKLVGFASALVAKPTQAFTVVTPEPTWEGTTKIAGSTSAILEAFEWNIKRQTAPIFNIDGNQTPYKIWDGPLTVDGKLTVLYEDEAEMAKYLTGATTALEVDFTHGASAALVELKLHSTLCQYTVAKIVRGKDYVELEIDFNAIANTTDVGATGGFSPMKATIQNALPASTYA